MLRLVEQTPVVKRAAATKIFRRDLNVESSGLEDRHRSLCDLRPKVVCKSVRPYDDLPIRGRRNIFAFSKPTLERTRCEFRDRPVRVDPGTELCKIRERRSGGKKINEAGHSRS